MRLVCLCLLVIGCAREQPLLSSTLIVGAPPSLRAPFESIVRSFRARHPESGANAIFGTPTEILGTGVPVDVLCSDSADGLAPLGGRALHKQDYASNPVVLVARPGLKDLRLKNLAQVKKLALGDPRSDATGNAAEAALGRLGVRRALDGKLLYVAAENGALERVARGEADAALVLSTDAVAWNAAHPGEQLPVVDRYTDDRRTRWPLAIVAGTPRISAARLLVEDVMTGEGRHTLDEKGYFLPPPDVTP
jgi:molybdate transport system substrate-binding protein